MPGAPVGPLLQQLRAGQGDHEQGLVARPLEEVLDDEHQRVRPLHVFEGEDRRVRVGEPFEEQTPRRNRSCRSGKPPRRVRAVAPTAARRSAAPRDRAGAPPARLGASAAPPRTPRPRRSPTPPHHVGQRPVRNPLAVGDSAHGASRSSRRSHRSTCRTPRPTATCRCRRSRSPRRVGPASPRPRRETGPIWRSSRSRPTNGASRPADLSAPARPETTRTALHSGVSPCLPLSSKLPAGS